MTRQLRGLFVLATGALLLTAASQAFAQGQAWGTLKGKVVWAGDTFEKKVIKPSQDKEHCESKGPLIDEDLVVNPKNKGVKWVFVWLAPEKGEVTDPVGPIHPKIDLEAIKKKPIVLDQPLCMFMPRSLALLEGQDLIVKNPAPFPHNIKWTGNPDINPGGNQSIPPGKSLTIDKLQAQKLPLVLECNIHPWMKGRMAVFSHPYFAITDADGNFEIANAPAGKFRMFVYQESIGWRNGREGSKGQPVEIKAGVNDLGSLDLK